MAEGQQQQQQQPLRIVVILGSVRTDRLCERVARLVADQLAASRHTVHILDPQELKLPLLDKPLHFYSPHETPPTVLSETNRKIAASEAIVLVSPEYNRSIPPALSNFIDHFPHDSYKWKPSAIVTYSNGNLAGLSAAVQLVGLMNEVGCPAIPNPLTIPRVKELISEHGEASEARLTQGVLTMIRNLEWFANAMKSQRLTYGTP